MFSDFEVSAEDSEIVPIDGFSSSLINNTFKWLKYHHNQKDKRCFDNNFLHHIADKYDICTFQLINAANFFNIESLTVMLSFHIGEKYSLRSYRSIIRWQINRNNNRLLLELAEKVFEIIKKNEDSSSVLNADKN